MNYTRALRKYFGMEKRSKKTKEPLMFKDHTNVINTLLTFNIKDNNFQRCSNFEFMNFIFDIEFQDEEINQVVQEVMYNLQKNFKYAGSSVLSAYNSCLWDKYDEIKLTEHLKEEDLKAFQHLASNDLSSDVDFFFKDTEDAFIFMNIVQFKLNELAKFFTKASSVLKDHSSKKRKETLFGWKAPHNQDIIDFFNYQKPLYKIDILKSIEKIKSNQSYHSMVTEKKNEMVNIKLGLTSGLINEIFDFSGEFSIDNHPKKILDYNITDESINCITNMSPDQFSVELNCILPGENARVRNRVPYFDILNCAMIWDFSSKEFDTKNITDSSNNYASDVFNILIKPWELIFNDRYIKEHFQPSCRSIDKKIIHPMDFLELEEDLDFINPETELEKFLEFELIVSKGNTEKNSFFSPKINDGQMMEVFRKLIPENVDIVDVRIDKSSYRTYNTLAYKEESIDKLLLRINKYQQKGYLINKLSNFIPVLLTSKLDNIFNIFTNDGMLSLLEESIEGVASTSQELLLSNLGEGSRHNDKEFKNIAKNLEVLEFMKNTIIKVHELKKGNLFDSNLKKIDCDVREETAVQF